MWTKNKLWALRQQIVLNALYVVGYRTDMWVVEHVCCDLFGGYMEYLGELMSEDGISDDRFFAHLGAYDTPENLESWYGCYCDEDPLPITEEEEEDEC